METKAIQKYEAQGVELLEHAKSIMIVDDTTRELAVEFTSNARKAIKGIEGEFRPDIDKAHTLHKDLLARLLKLILPFQAAQAIVDKEIARDYLEQKKVRDMAETAACLKAATERIVQEAEIEEEVGALIGSGDMAEAEALLDSEVVTAPIVPVAQVDKTVKSGAGSATVRKDIKVELVSKADVIIAVSEHTLPDTLLDVNMGVAKRYAKTSGLSIMPGFNITETAIVSGRIG